MIPPCYVSAPLSIEDADSYNKKTNDKSRFPAACYFSKIPATRKLITVCEPFMDY